MLPAVSERVAVVAAALGADPRVAARRAREMGFGGLQFDAISPAFDATDLSQTGRRELTHVLSSQGQRLAGLRYDVGPAGLRPGVDIDRLLWQMDKVLAAAAGLRAPVVSVELGALPEPADALVERPKVDERMLGLLILPPAVEAAPPPAVRPPSPADAAFEASVDNTLAALAGLCDRQGITLAFRSDLASLAALDRAVRTARCPWFGVDLDPVALLQDRWSADEVFSQLGGLVRHVRGRDALGGGQGTGGRTRPMPIGRGGTLWPKLLRDLDASGYHGFVTVDPMELTDRALGASIALAHLKALV